MCLLACLVAFPARAEDADVRARLAWLDHSLSEGALGARLWWGGWMSYAAAEAGYGWYRYARAGDRLQRDLWLVTGLGSSLWIAQLLLFPMHAAYAPRSLHSVPTRSPSERRLALARAEQLLDRAARAECESLHWSEHLLDLGWAIGSAAYVFGHNYRHTSHARLYRETGIELGLTILLSEAAILTTPRRAIRDRERYRAGSWSMQVGVTGASWTVRF